MKQIEARAMYPHHTLKFSQGVVNVHVKRAREPYATVTQHEDKVVVSVRSGLNEASQPFTAVIEVSSYANTHSIEKALNAERSFDGLGPAPYPMVKRTFRKSQEQDYAFAIELLAIFLRVGDGKRFRADQMPFLTATGKKIYNNLCERDKVLSSL